MDLALDQFSSNFGAYATPNILKELLDFQTASHTWYCEGFELSVIEQEELREHIIKGKISQFLGFGHDANYSIYALWLYQDVPLEEAPVVYFNSEGEGSTVFANNLFEFLTLLARNEEPIFGKYSEQEKFVNKNVDAIIEEYRQYIHNDESIEDVIAHLHMEGLTITDSMKALRLLYGIRLGEAKKLVAAHPVWLSVVQANEPFHAELERIAELLSKPDVSDDDIKNYEKKENEK